VNGLGVESVRARGRVLQGEGSAAGALSQRDAIADGGGPVDGWQRLLLAGCVTGAVVVVPAGKAVDARVGDRQHCTEANGEQIFSQRQELARRKGFTHIEPHGQPVDEHVGVSAISDSASCRPTVS
jgi:hypothetical protein